MRAEGGKLAHFEGPVCSFVASREGAKIGRESMKYMASRQGAKARRFDLYWSPRNTLTTQKREVGKGLRAQVLMFKRARPQTTDE